MASAKKQKRTKLPEWASRISALRRHSKISQGELAQRVQCSAMTVSRWERGLQAPTAHYYIQLGHLAAEDDCWFFWEHAGLQIADVTRALPAAHLTEPLFPPLESASAGSGARISEVSRQRLVALPVLKAVAGAHGNRGDKKLSLDRIAVDKLIGAPSDWCPNPRNTSLLRVRGHSMEPLIGNGAILAVDSSQTERSELAGKVVVVTQEENGLCVSRLQRYDNVEVLESENRSYQPIVLGKDSGWRVVGKVLWWISAAP